MIPTSVSATALEVYEECPARFYAEKILRAPQLSGSAAALGTVCHAVMEDWVKNGWYLDPLHTFDNMAQMYNKQYWKLFTDNSRFEEGKKLLRSWLARQDWTDRTVISVEIKETHNFNTSMGPIPFNYVMDRLDMLNTGEPEVVDYKTLAAPLTPEDVRNKFQAKCYGLMAQIMYPKAERVWVMFDMLRFDRVGCAFTREENRAFGLYLKDLLERVIADNDPQEVLNPGCRWCIRKSQCKTMQRHVQVGGPLSISDPFLAVQKMYELECAVGGLNGMIADLQPVIMEHLDKQGITSFEFEGLLAELTSRNQRTIDPERVAQIVGADRMIGYLKMGVGQADELIKNDPNFTTEEKRQIKQLFRTTTGQASIKIKKKPVV